MNFNFKVNSKASSLFLPFLISSYLKPNTSKQNSKSLKCNEEPSEADLPLSPFDSDDPEFDQLQQILNDPNIDPEMYREIMMESKNIGIQPMKFNQLHAGLKSDVDDECWSGLRLTLNWKPTNVFNSEVQLNVDGKQKPFSKYRISATTIIYRRDLQFNIATPSDVNQSNQFNLQLLTLVLLNILL